MVAAGIFLSRLSGLARDAAIAALLGTGRAADIWSAGLRLPNILQNLLGEGTLSASFIPVYARYLEEGREEEAGRFAGAVLGLLIVVAYGLALIGIALAPFLARVLVLGPATLMIRVGIPAEVWGPAEIATLTTVLRTLFPMTATLVISAWALGVLNSHRRFFLSYVAPVFWNAAIVAVAVWLVNRAGSGEADLLLQVRWLSVGALIGGVLQLAVQLPTVSSLLSHFRLSLGRGVAGVREAIDNFIPVVLGRGVVNLSALIDVALAAALASGAIATISRAQTLYLLPIALFGMAIAASELPELSRSGPEAREAIAGRVRGALERVRFFLIPTVFAYLVLGDLFVSGLYERGEFKADDSRVVGLVLAAYSLGLVASGSSRTLSSAFYALRDTKTPAKIAVIRVVLSLVVGGLLMFRLDAVKIGTFGLGGAGLALGASAGAWLEYGLLRRALSRAVGPHGPRWGGTARMLAAALLAAATGWLVRAPIMRFSTPLENISLPGLGSFGLDHLMAAGVTALLFGAVYIGVIRVMTGKLGSGTGSDA